MIGVVEADELIGAALAHAVVFENLVLEAVKVAAAAAAAAAAAEEEEADTAVRAEASAAQGNAEVVLLDIVLAEPELVFELRSPPDSTSSCLVQPLSQY